MMENGGYFGGWTLNTWILVFLWAIGGILVALCIKYTDVIIKGFASAISLILISLIGWQLLGDTLDLIFVLGAIITIVATFNYNEQDAKATLTTKASDVVAMTKRGDGSPAIEENLDSVGVETVMAKNVDMSPTTHTPNSIDVSDAISCTITMLPQLKQNYR